MTNDAIIKNLRTSKDWRDIWTVVDTLIRDQTGGQVPMGEFPNWVSLVLRSGVGFVAALHPSGPDERGSVDGDGH